MKYIFRPSHVKCLGKTEAARPGNYNFPDFLTKRLVDLFIIHSQINHPFATQLTLLSQCKLALTAMNTIFHYEISGALSK